ncbi:MAG: acetate/propionate family kinase [Pseudomonadota bacterium]
MSETTLLVINAGSSSIKFALYGALGGGQPRRRLDGQIEGMGRAPRIKVKDDEGKPLREEALDANLDEATLLADLITWLKDQPAAGHLVAVGHRVVFGGVEYTAPAIIDDTLLDALDALVPLMPLHLPKNLAPIRALKALNPDLLQVACFDTAFHTTQPRLARLFGLPRELAEEGLLRYGFHGLSYEYIAGVLPGYDGAAARGRTIVAHLGSGASLCALQEGRSVATTMGFSALDGLVMGTRPGLLDPGVLLYLLREKGMSAADLEDLLYRRSGLLGLSGISNDVRDLLASDAAEAAEALDLFCYRTAREIGSLAAALGGLDALVFTAGVGEHAPDIRARIAERCSWLGLEFDPVANERGGPQISRPDSRVSTWVIPTDEDLMIANHTRHLLPERALKLSA